MTLLSESLQPESKTKRRFNNLVFQKNLDLNIPYIQVEIFFAEQTYLLQVL